MITGPDGEGIWMRCVDGQWYSHYGQRPENDEEWKTGRQVNESTIEARVERKPNREKTYWYFNSSM